jgi:hypothetical protein
MISLCDTNQKGSLQRLLDLVADEKLSGTEAWSAFSAPAQLRKFKKKGAKERAFEFSESEIASYRGIRQLVKNRLFETCGGSCSYCRRPVGHYGWAWHIEHVFPKSAFASLTFSLSNLTVGCVHCNMWKGAAVDRKVKSKKLPIINPVSIPFSYSEHLKYLQFGTESMSFAKYFYLTDVGRETYKLLSFKEIERAHAIVGLDGAASALHERISKGIELGLSSDDGEELLSLMQRLKTSIFAVP